MDAASAAAMSDPHRNPHFRRRWNEGFKDAPRMSAPPGREAVGTFGLMLQEALTRANNLAIAVGPLQPPEDSTDG